MEGVVATGVASSTTKCLLLRCFAFCRSKCVGDEDETDSEYHVQDSSVQYNLVCCSTTVRDQDKSFQYTPAARNSGNYNYLRTGKDGFKKDQAPLS